MKYIEFDESRPMDLVLLGRVAIDFNPAYNDQVKEEFKPLKKVHMFEKFVGGSPANIAVGVTKHGLKAGFIGKVSDDQFGEYVVDYFDERGIDTSQITKCTNGEKLGLTFTEMLSPKESSILMYRNRIADLQLHVDDIHEDYIKNAKAILISGTALAESPSREAAIKAVMLAKKVNTKIIFDIDYREYNWKNADEISIYYSIVAKEADIIMGSREEFDLTEKLIKEGMTDEESAAYWQAKNAKIVVIKHGMKGSTAYTVDGQKFSIKPFPVEARKGFGGGDGYGSGFLYGLYQGWEIIDCLEFGSAEASMMVKSNNCSDSLPGPDEVHAFIKDEKEKFGEMIARVKMANTVRMTTAQAIVKFLDNQYVSMDGVETKFVEGFFTIFGHGIAVGLGEALDTNPGQLKVLQGRNEQGMCHVATAFAKQSNRKKIIACASSIGPGAANMVTACATATVNNIPLLVFPADTFASRQPDPVLQQLEQSSSLAISTNDAFKPVCKYWDRITRPEMVMTALINAMRVLTDPAETGACCIALCQDVEGESFDFPEYFFKKRVHRITRPVAVEEELEDVAEVIAGAKKPLIVVGGGVRYSEAGEAVEKFCEEFKIPFGETQAGKSACQSGNPYCLGGIGVTGTYASNIIGKDADVVISIGSRMSDFTTSSKHLFQNEDVQFVSINNCRFHAYKMDAVKAVGDAKATVEALAEKLRARGYKSAYTDEIEKAKAAWDKEMERLGSIEYTGDDFEPLIKARDPRTIPEYVKLTNGKITQTAALAAINRTIDKDATIITAGGSLPSCMQRMWRTDKRGGYHAEYGYSCMGYEVAATLGVKFAEPDNEVYCVVGDSSFQMLHSEIMTIMQERQKVNIMVFDNCGFGCINNLEMNHGIGSLATEFRYTDGKKPTGDLIPVDYAKIGEGYGLKTYTCRTIQELVDALEDAKKQEIACLFDLKVIPKTMTDGYESWWDVGIATTSEKESVRKACEGVMKGREEARLY